MPSVPDRRHLVFHSLAEISEDVRLLDQRGYRSVGKWDLSQICNHLADWMGYPVAGFPKPPWPIAALLGVLRFTIGKRQLRSILARGEMPQGGPTLAETIHPPMGDHAKAMERLFQAIRTLENHQGPIHPSPLFGPMDKATCIRLQLIHCAHHLSFLRPQ